MGSPAKNVWVPRHMLSFCAWKVKGGSFDGESGKKPALVQKSQNVKVSVVGINGRKRPKVPVFGCKIQTFLAG